MKASKTTVIGGIIVGVVTLLIGVLAKQAGLDLLLVLLVQITLGLWILWRLINTRINVLLRETRVEQKKNERTGYENRQLDAYIALNAVLQPRYPLPSLRNWAISAEVANLLVETIGWYKPRVILECGSGASTLIVSYCLMRQGGGHIYSLEHLKDYAQQTRDLLALHQLTEYGTILEAPLVKVQIDGRDWSWYHPAVLDQIQGVDLLIVDGPPGHLSEMARYPALPMLVNKLSDNAIILLDDMQREDERTIAKLWSEQFGFSVITGFNPERGASLLKRQ